MVLPPDLGAALRRLVDRPFVLSQKQQENAWRAVRTGAYPKVLEFERMLVARLAKMGVPAFTHCVVRSSKAQADAFALGHSKARPGSSPHNFGLAVDVVHSTKGWAMSKLEWQVFGHVGEQLAVQLGIKMEWGGRWKFYDPAHWELIGWRDLKARYPFPKPILKPSDTVSGEKPQWQKDMIDGR